MIKILCNANGLCENGENFANCPEDCEMGIADDSCDGIADGRVDPDCAPGFDPDSGTAKPAETLGPSIPGFELIYGLLTLAAVYVLTRKH